MEKKGIEILKSQEIKKSKDVKTIIVTESSLDSLAYAQLHNIDPKESILCATGGQMGEQAPKVLNNIIKKGENPQVVLGFDNDESGKKFTEKMLQELQTQNIKVQTPVYKDFCEDLAMFNLISYNQFQLRSYSDEKNNLKSLISEKLTDTLKTLNNENTSENIFHREQKVLQNILKIHKPNSTQIKFIEFVKENAMDFGREKEK